MKQVFLSILMTLLLAGSALAQTPGVPMVFEIPEGMDPNKVHIQFLVKPITGSYRDTTGTKQTLEESKSYSLAEITSPVSVGGGAPANQPAVFITGYDSGRVYLNFGDEGLGGLGGDYQPVANLDTDVNKSVRYQYFEPTIAGAQCNIDLSYIDFTSISLSLQAINAPHAHNNPQITTGSATQMANATARTGKSESAVLYPTGTKNLPDPSFVRVLSPQIWGSNYHDWTHYLKTTLPNKTARLSGCFSGVGSTQPTGDPATTKQCYDYTATFNQDGSVNLKPNKGSGNAACACVPKDDRGVGVGTDYSMKITFDQLNTATGIYGANPAYSLTHTSIGHTANFPGITNDVFGRVIGDLVSGLCFGFVGSTIKFQGTPIGELHSTQWWGGTTEEGVRIDVADTPAGKGVSYDKAQPKNPLNYHGYAGSLRDLTPAYGFALADRMNNNTIAFNTTTDPGSYIKVIVNPDSHLTHHLNNMLLLDQ